MVDIPQCIDDNLSYLHRMQNHAKPISKSVVCVTCVEWHPDGGQFAVGCNHGVVLVFTIDTPNTTQPQLSYTITTADSALERISFSPCGTMLATTHVSGMQGIFEAAPAGQLVLTIQEPMPPHVASASLYRIAK